jgi:hypothetical protein
MTENRIDTKAFRKANDSKKTVQTAYPPSLFLGAVGVSIQTREHSSGRHKFTGFVPTMGVAKTRSISLALTV